MSATRLLEPPRSDLGRALAVLAAVGGAVAALCMPVRPWVPRGARASTRQLVVGGARRSELVLSPAAPVAGRLPLYVVLHGSTASPAWEEQRTGLAPLAAAGRALLVYPAGVAKSWNAGQGCCLEAGARHVDDVAFVEAVVADAVAHLDADPARVYLVGYSNGGKLALRMAEADPGLFAGIATYAAVPLVPVGSGPPVPLLLAGGTADDRTAWSGPPTTSGGVTSPSVTGALGAYLARYGLAGTAPQEERLPGGVEVRTWRGNGPRDVVRLVAYGGRGHGWPERHDAPTPLAPLIEAFFSAGG